MLPTLSSDEIVPTQSFSLTRFPIAMDGFVPDSLVGSPNNLTVRQEYDHRLRGMVFHLRAWLLTATHTDKHTAYFNTPKTWWQHFKETHFPLWLKKQFPVVYTQVPFEYEKDIHVCPHSNIAWPDAVHLDFVMHGKLQDRPYGLSAEEWRQRYSLADSAHDAECQNHAVTANRIAQIATVMGLLPKDKTVATTEVLALADRIITQLREL